MVSASSRFSNRGKLTNLDVSSSVEKHVVTLDITVNDVLVV